MAEWSKAADLSSVNTLLGRPACVRTALPASFFCNGLLGHPFCCAAWVVFGKYGVCAVHACLAGVERGGANNGLDSSSSMVILRLNNLLHTLRDPNRQRLDNSQALTEQAKNIDACTSSTLYNIVNPGGPSSRCDAQLQAILQNCPLIRNVFDTRSMDSSLLTRIFRQLLSHETCSTLRAHRLAAQGRQLSCSSSRLYPQRRGYRQEHRQPADHIWQQRAQLFPEDRNQEYQEYPMVTSQTLRNWKRRPRKVKMLMRDFIEGM